MSNLNNAPTFIYKDELTKKGFELYDTCGCGGTKNEKFKFKDHDINIQPQKSIYIYKYKGVQLEFNPIKDLLKLLDKIK